MLFVLLMVLSRFCKRRGVLTGAYLAGYAVMRFVLEYYRYDAERGLFWGLSTSQWISLVLFPVGIAIIVYSWKSGKAERKIVTE